MVVKGDTSSLDYGTYEIHSKRGTLNVCRNIGGSYFLISKGFF